MCSEETQCFRVDSNLLRCLICCKFSLDHPSSTNRCYLHSFLDIRSEEQFLAKQNGDEYRKYRTRVRRYF